MDIWGTLTDVYNYVIGGGGASGCTSSGNSSAPAPSATTAPAEPPANYPLALTGPEISAIMSYNRGRGDACSLHQMSGASAAEVQDFWSDAADYILENKFASRGRNESPAIAQAYEALSPNQQAEVRTRLAVLLQQTGNPFNLVVHTEDYTAACMPGLFMISQPYPVIGLGSVTPAAIRDLVTRVGAEPATATASAAPGATGCSAESVAACLRSDQNILAQILHDFASYFDIFDLADRGDNAVVPNSMRQGSNGPVVLHGQQINLGPTLPAGLTVTFSGEGVATTPGQPITLTAEGFLSVPVTVAANAPVGEARDITIRVGDRIIGTYPRGFNVGLTVVGNPGRRERPPRTVATAPGTAPTTPPPTSDFCLQNPAACL